MGVLTVPFFKGCVMSPQLNKRSFNFKTSIGTQTTPWITTQCPDIVRTFDGIFCQLLLLSSSLTKGFVSYCHYYCVLHTHIYENIKNSLRPLPKLWNANSSWDILIRHLFDIIEIDVNTSFFKISKPKHVFSLGWDALLNESKG